MLQRGLTHLSLSSLNLAPLLASCSSSICSQLPCSNNGSGNGTFSTTAAQSSSSSAAVYAAATASSSSTSVSTSSSGYSAVPVKSPFRVGAVELKQLPGRKSKPYFNPDDGAEAYKYWEDMWKRENKLRKRQIPKRIPVYLEKDEQEALCEAAVAAGVPSEVVYGDTNKHELPRLIHYIYMHQPKFVQRGEVGGIPTDPYALKGRIKQLRGLENSVPGFDAMRIFKLHGFGILTAHPQKVQKRINRLGEHLREAGVSAEAGLVFSAEPRLSSWRPQAVAERAKQLPEQFQNAVGSSPDSLLRHPVQALLLRQTSAHVGRNLRRLKNRHGKEGAAKLATQLPHLIQCRPQGLDLKLAVLADGLSSSPAASLKVAKQLVQREPRLLTHSSEVLQQRKQGLAKLLELNSPEELLRVLQVQPSILHKRTDTLDGKLTVLAQALQLSDAAVAAIAKQRPRLICMSFKRIAAPLKYLQSIPANSLLAPIKAQATMLCTQYPKLMQMRVQPDATSGQQDSLSSRLQLLQDLAGSSPAWQARVTQLLAGEDLKDLAVVLGHRNTWERLRAVLGAQGQKEKQDGEVSELLQLLEMPSKEFDALYPSAAADSAPVAQE